METLAYLGAIAICFVLYKVHGLIKVPKEIEHLPHIPILPLIKSFFSGLSCDQQFEQLHRPVLSKLGYARIWMFGKWEIIVADLKDAREILNDPETFTKAPEGGDHNTSKMLIYKFLGRGINTTDGEEWRRHRRAANPAFKKGFRTSLIGECAIELNDKINQMNQQPVIVRDLFINYSLDVLGRVMFSYNFEAVKNGDNSKYIKMYNEIMSVIFDPLYFTLPALEDWIPSRRYYHNKNLEFRNFLLDIIRERQVELKNGSEKDDLLSSIIKASWEENEGARLTDIEVLDDLASFFLAGQDTTANTLTTTFYYLAKHQEIQDKLRQEILSVLGDDGTPKIPTSEQLKSMLYLDCVIKESIRIVTTSQFLRRYCSKSVTLGSGLTIPGDTFVQVHQWAIHHNPEIYPNHEVFYPDRFLDLNGSQNRSWIGFGDGSRMCIGLNLTLMEQRIVSVMLLQEFILKLGPQARATENPTILAAGLAYPINMDVIFSSRE